MTSPIDAARIEFRKQFCKLASDNGLTPSELLTAIKQGGIEDYLQVPIDIGKKTLDIGWQGALLSAGLGAALGTGGAYAYNALTDTLDLPLPDGLTPSKEELSRDLIDRYRQAANEAKNIKKPVHDDTATEPVTRFRFG